MSIIELLILFVFLYIAYAVLRWVLGLLWSVLLWVGALIDQRPAALIRRRQKAAEKEIDAIVDLTKRKHIAIGQMYEHLSEASDRAARDIVNIDHRR